MTPIDILFDLIAIVYVLCSTTGRLFTTPVRVVYRKASYTLSLVTRTLYSTTKQVHQRVLATRAQLYDANLSTTLTTRLSPIVQDSLLFIFAPIVIIYHTIRIQSHSLRSQVHEFAIDSADRAKDCLHIVLHTQPDKYRQMDVQLQYLRKQVAILLREVEEKSKLNRRLEGLVGDLKAEIDVMRNAATQDREAQGEEYKRLDELHTQLKAELKETKKASEDMQSAMKQLQEKIKSLEDEKQASRREYAEIGVGEIEKHEGEHQVKNQDQEMTIENEKTLNVPKMSGMSLRGPKTSLQGSSKDHRRTVSFNGHHFHSHTEPDNLPPQPLTPPGSTRRVSGTRSRRRSLINRVRSGLGLSQKYE